MKRTLWCLLFLFFSITAHAASYTVQEGDWLIKIARKSGCTSSWQTIAAMNNLKNPHHITPNQVLELPPQCDAEATQAQGSNHSGNTVVISHAQKETLWKSYGVNPVGCDVPTEDVLKRFKNLSDEDRRTFLGMYERSEGKVVRMERGMQIGDMTGGRMSMSWNTVIDFQPMPGDVMIVYEINRTEVDGMGGKTRVRSTLSMPTACCNWALKVERTPEQSAPPPPVVVMTPEQPSPPEPKSGCPTIVCPHSPSLDCRARTSSDCSLGKYPIGTASQKDARQHASDDRISRPLVIQNGDQQFVSPQVAKRIAESAEHSLTEAPPRESHTTNTQPDPVPSWRLIAFFSSHGDDITAACAFDSRMQIGNHRCMPTVTTVSKP